MSEEKLKELEEKFNGLKKEVENLKQNDILLTKIAEAFQEALRKIVAQIEKRINNEIEINGSILKVSQIIGEMINRETELRRMVDRLSQPVNKEIAKA